MSIVRTAVLTICVASIAGMLVRPRGTPEWTWALGGAAMLALFGLVPPADVAAALASGTNVYLFLTGMLLLSELARREGVFDWLAALAVRAARGSALRLFALVYGAGIAVTIVLSNDATAVVLTPAVAAAVRKAKAEPLPHLYACAFIANAASFVLPISNPANLVVFAHAMPALPRWLATFGVPSCLSIGATYGALFFVSRGRLRDRVESAGSVPALHDGGRIALGGIGITAAALLIASFHGVPLGAATCACGAAVFLAACVRDSTTFLAVMRAISWTILLLVAGLFVLIRGLDAAGLLGLSKHVVDALSLQPRIIALLGTAGLSAAASNVLNNLPAGLIAGSVAAGIPASDTLRAALAIGIDVGPNLSVTGSLATVLWLAALRREGIVVSTWTFLRVGAVVMPPALLLATLALAVRG